MTDTPDKSLPTHQHTSQTQKQAKEEWVDLVKATETQVEFDIEWRKWMEDKSNSAKVVEVGKSLMEQQQKLGKPGGRLSYHQVMHRVETAKDVIAKGLAEPVAKNNNRYEKLIKKRANGDTVWVIK